MMNCRKDRGDALIDETDILVAGFLALMRLHGRRSVQKRGCDQAFNDPDPEYS